MSVTELYPYVSHRIYLMCAEEVANVNVVIIPLQEIVELNMCKRSCKCECCDHSSSRNCKYKLG